MERCVISKMRSHVVLGAPDKHRFIAGSAKCSSKPLSKLLTTILTTVKDGLKKYCDKIYSRSGMSKILKSSQ